jgi:hypothetical protein
MQEDHEAYKLLAEGEAALKAGSPEAQIYKLVRFKRVALCGCASAFVIVLTGMFLALLLRSTQSPAVEVWCT